MDVSWEALFRINNAAYLVIRKIVLETQTIRIFVIHVETDKFLKINIAQLFNLIIKLKIVKFIKEIQINVRNVKMTQMQFKNIILMAINVLTYQNWIAKTMSIRSVLSVPMIMNWLQMVLVTKYQYRNVKKSWKMLILNAKSVLNNIISPQINSNVYLMI